jgi:hypothetical protein
MNPAETILAISWRQRPSVIAVAQIWNLLYRRIAFGKPLSWDAHMNCGSLADYKSAIQQNLILRYSSGDGRQSKLLSLLHFSVPKLRYFRAHALAIP